MNQILFVHHRILNSLASEAGAMISTPWEWLFAIPLFMTFAILCRTMRVAVPLDHFVCGKVTSNNRTKPIFEYYCMTPMQNEAKSIQ